MAHDVWPPKHIHINTRAHIPGAFDITMCYDAATANPNQVKLLMPIRLLRDPEPHLIKTHDMPHTQHEYESRQPEFNTL